MTIVFLVIFVKNWQTDVLVCFWVENTFGSKRWYMQQIYTKNQQSDQFLIESTSIRQRN